MPRPKGLPKTGGRTKGSINKSTLFLKDALDQLQLNIPKKLNELLPSLPVEKQADVLLKLLNYVYPQVSSQPMEQLDATNITFDSEEESNSVMTEADEISVLEMALLRKKNKLQNSKAV